MWHIAGPASFCHVNHGFTKTCFAEMNLLVDETYFPDSKIHLIKFFIKVGLASFCHFTAELFGRRVYVLVFEVAITH